MTLTLDAAAAGTPPLERAMRIGLAKLAQLQDQDGAWRGDYGGPMFLLPMYISARHIAGRAIPAAQGRAMIAYLRGVLNTDGSIGLHVEASGAMFTTALSYVSLRILGIPRGDPDLMRMRRWIMDNGTALGCASWGKFILALLNLYEYEGLNPILPELWGLPRAAPIHPSRLWCHCRQVYLPMAYLYGIRAHAPESALIVELRKELYAQPYEEISWRQHRETVAASDDSVPASGLLRLSNRLLGVFEEHHPARVRRRCLESLLEHIRHEDHCTSFIRIGPVNAILNSLVHFFHDPEGADTERSFTRLVEYLWEGPDGVKMNGYNSTALWDTAFATQAILATPMASEHGEMLDRAHDFIRDNQVLEDVPHRERYFRHASRGGWPFSDRDHGWPITDCTSEGLKCALALEPRVERPVPEELLAESIKLILSFQNADGGWATYERQRGGGWLERLNPSQVFSDIMVDTSYVECTSACIQALARGRERFPGRFDEAIDDAVTRGAAFIRGAQRDDGSWEGSWAVCFTYGAWFGVTGLRAAGVAATDRAITGACQFLKSHQNADGGWGEHFTSCVERRYVPHEESQVVNTAWALLALISGGQGGTPNVERGVRLLLEMQQPDGDWPRQSLCGVFNKTTLINYDNYRRYFPIWALARYTQEQAPQQLMHSQLTVLASGRSEQWVKAP